MRYVFSSQFLKVQHPDTSFADAWESLCYDLLRYEHVADELQALRAPDHGIDILNRTTRFAFQCKSDERGASGTISPGPSIESLRRATAARSSFSWKTYRFATNAPYSGEGTKQIEEVVRELGLAPTEVSFAGPQLWSDLCEKHLARVATRFDYRLLYTEAEVVEAFRKARYYEAKVREYESLLVKSPLEIELSNNRTPLKLRIPFSRELTVSHCIDVAMSLLGLSLRTERYPDLGTRASPSVSITVDRIPQPLDVKLGEIPSDALERLELWITVRWAEEGNERDPRMMELLLARGGSRPKAETVRRFVEYLETSMWSAVARGAG